MTPPAPGHRFGFIAVCGRPNVGKSTLINALVGQDVAVATAQPQTTRERMLGIWTRPTSQIVLVDTPGIHRARSALNRFMVQQALGASRDVDGILFLAEAPMLASEEAALAWTPGEVAVEGLTALQGLGRPVVLVLTKCDRLRDPKLLLPVIQAWTDRHEFAAVVPISALKSQGLDALAAAIEPLLAVGPPHYGPDQLTDRSLRWHAAELIRGELFTRLSEELPYSCAVLIDSFNERTDRDSIEARIWVERDSQRGIVVGRGGRTIKAISMAARSRISDLTGRPCDLRIRVDVARDWTSDPQQLARLGYAAADPVAVDELELDPSPQTPS